jgi:hypothetical protein
MGLLDWLTDGLGNLGGSMPPGMFDGGIGPQGPGDIAPPQTPMPPMQMTGEDTRVPNFNMGQMPIRPPEADGMPAPPAGASVAPPNLAADGMSMPPGMGPPISADGMSLPPGLGNPISADGMPAPNSMGAPGAPPPGVPLPMPRPPMDAAAPSGQPPGLMMRPGLNRRSTEPVPATAPPMDTAGAVQSYQKAGGNFAPLDGMNPQAKSIIGRALGLDPNTESQLRGSLAGGLKAAGNSAGKSPFQAFSSGAGEGMEGGKKADDKTTEQQDKYLQRAIAAKREGNTAEYNKNYLRYQIESTKARLEAAKEKAAGATAKASVMNSPEQLYLRADRQAVSESGALKSQYEKTAQQFGADSKEAKAALEAYNKGVTSAREGLYGKLGLDPKKASEIGQKPGMSDKNPVKDFPKDPSAAQKAFEALPDGAYFVNPKDGRLLRKRSQEQAAPQQVSAMTPLMPPMPPGIAPSYESESEAA